MMTVPVIVAVAKSLCTIYPSDLDMQSPDEIIQFSKFMANEKNISALSIHQSKVMISLNPTTFLLTTKRTKLHRNVLMLFILNKEKRMK